MSFSLFAVLAFASTPNTQQIPSGKKAKITGQILSRNGDLINVKDNKSGQVVVNVTDGTNFVRKMGTFKFRHANMDVTAMVPGLTIDAEGVGNAKGQLDGSNISFSPDDFASEVAEEQQIRANNAAAAQAQPTASQTVSNAAAAQSSANQAQMSADQAQTTTNPAGAVTVIDAAAVEMVNQRVSDLGDYKTVAEAGIYFATGKSALNDAAKADLSKLADLAMGTQDYMIEIAGYASSAATKQVNQQLGQARATTVTNYLRDAKNVPMRRILVPASYGATHPASTNTDSMGRALSQRVDVKIIVNKGLNEGM